MKKKKGFTLVELIAVIVIIAIVALIGGSSVLSILNRTRKETAKEMQENLKEVALTYISENVKIRPKVKCSVGFSETMYGGSQDEITEALNFISEQDSNCIAKITIQTLKDEGLFEDTQNHCSNDDIVVVYRYQDEFGNSEYKAYTSETTCTN